jgi:hypothetical protein
MDKTPKPIAADPYLSTDRTVRRALILDQARGTTLDLISGTAKWVRSRFRDLEQDLREIATSGAVDASDLIRQLACLQGLTHQLHAQNTAMLVLYDLATEWPADVEVTVPAYTDFVPTEKST